MNYIAKSANRCLKICASKRKKCNVLKSVRRIAVMHRPPLFRGYYTQRICPMYSRKRLFSSNRNESILNSSCAPGTFITQYYWDIFAEKLPDDDPNTSDIAKRWYQSIAYVCRGDGILGVGEEEWIRSRCQRFEFDEKTMAQILSGAEIPLNLDNWVDEKGFTELHLKNTGVPRDINAQKHSLILLSLIASAQDGLPQSEVTAAYELAQKLGVSKSKVDELVGIMKAEQELFDKLRRNV
eukprot:275651_1